MQTPTSVSQVPCSLRSTAATLHTVSQCTPEVAVIAAQIHKGQLYPRMTSKHPELEYFLLALSSILKKGAGLVHVLKGF